MDMLCHLRACIRWRCRRGACMDWRQAEAVFVHRVWTHRCHDSHADRPTGFLHALCTHGDRRASEGGKGDEE